MSLLRLELVEVNPILDQRDGTAALAVERLTLRFADGSAMLRHALIGWFLGGLPRTGRDPRIRSASLTASRPRTR